MSQIGTFSTSGGGGTGTVVSLTGNTGGAVNPDVFTGNINIVGGGGVTVTGNAGTSTLTVTTVGAGITWTEVTTAILPAGGEMTINNGYIINYNGVSTLKLPSIAQIGSVIEVIQYHPGTSSGFLIDCNLMTIIDGVDSFAVNLGFTNKYLSSGAAISLNGSIKLICTVANSIWTVVRERGSNWKGS